MSQLGMFGDDAPETVRFLGPDKPGLKTAITFVTDAQRSHLHTLHRALGGGQVAVVGFDACRSIVVSRRDQNGVATYSIRGDGCGVTPTEPVGDLTDDEVERFNPRDHQYIRSFPTKLQEATS